MKSGKENIIFLILCVLVFPFAVLYELLKNSR